MQISMPNNNKWRHNDVITKNNAKFGPSWNQTKYISFEGIDEGYPKYVFFYWIWTTVSKVMDIFVKFWLFSRFPVTKYGHVTWPKMQISKILYFILILYLILGKVRTFPVEKLSTSKVISQKPHRGGGGGGVESTSAFRINSILQTRQYFHINASTMKVISLAAVPL